MKTICKIKPNVILKEINSQIYLLSFNSNYEMCMTFLRYQESYESPSLKFRGKNFTIIDFMEWYSKTYGNGAFTYANDWSGFNLPGLTIYKLHQLGIKDPNKYDDVMKKVYDICFNRTKSNNFYIIGVYGKGEALDHEMAHGFFYTKRAYKKEMIKLVNDIPKNIKNKLCDKLSDLGYAKTVYVDELQAFLSTGLTPGFGRIKIANIRKPFIKLFKQYYMEGK